MNVYTDPTLLDVAGALDALPDDLAVQGRIDRAARSDTGA